jgi:hypothetical protein
MPLTKQQLEVVNQTNFPNNTTGYISPTLLREFNTDIIDNTVNQTLYNADSSSVSAQLVGLNSYTQSLSTNFITSASLNAATASLSASLTTTINTKLPTSTFNTYTSSTNGRLDTIETNYASKNALNTFTQNQTFQYSVSIGNDLGVTDQLSVTGSLSASGFSNYGDSILGGNAYAVNTIKGYVYFTNPEKVYFGTQNWTDFSSSVVYLLNSSSAFPAYSTSVNSRVAALESWSSSLTDVFASDAELNASSSTLQGNINRKLDTSSFNSYSASAFSQSLFVSNSLQTTITNLSSSNYQTDVTQSNNLTLLSQSLFFTDTTQSVNININSQSAWGAFQSASAYSASAASASTFLSASVSSSYVSKAAINQTLVGTITISGSISVTGASSFSGSLNVLSGSSSGSIVTNVGDIYSSSAAVQKIISLTSAEYTALTPKDSNTLYIII